MTRGSWLRRGTASQPAPDWPADHASGALRSKDPDALVYGPEAAALVGVAPSTIRMWVLRGRLRSVDLPGRPLFRVSAVLRAARRKR